ARTQLAAGASIAANSDNSLSILRARNGFSRLRRDPAATSSDQSGNTDVTWTAQRAGSDVPTAWSAEKMRRAINGLGASARMICTISNGLRRWPHTDDNPANHRSWRAMGEI